MRASGGGEVTRIGREEDPRAAGDCGPQAPPVLHPHPTTPTLFSCCRLPQVVLKAIQPYTRVRIPFIAQQLNVPAADVEQLLISLILDGRIEGRIDQVQQVRWWHVGCGGWVW